MTADLSTTATSLLAHAQATTAPGTGDTAGSLVAADIPSVVQAIDWLAIAPPPSPRWPPWSSSSPTCSCPPTANGSSGTPPSPRSPPPWRS